MTVNVVVAAPLAGVTVAGLKVQLMPVTGEQENVTLSAKPPAGVIVKRELRRLPAVTVAVGGAAPERNPGWQSQW